MKRPIKLSDEMRRNLAIPRGSMQRYVREAKHVRMPLWLAVICALNLIGIGYCVRLLMEVMP